MACIGWIAWKNDGYVGYGDGHGLVPGVSS